MDELKAKIKNAPHSPGCYIFKDKHGWIIYVGKSKNLNGRVKQYFQKSNQKDEKGQRLAREITDVEYMVTDTEINALILEYRLIKQHKPYLNVLMKADKRYPYIKINPEGRYPSFSVTKDKTPGDGDYFGCFRHEEDAEKTLYRLNKVWKTPVCGKPVFDRLSRPCLEYHMGNCMAPCDGRADPAAYETAVKEIRRLFAGLKVQKAARLKKEMEQAARDMEYEKAAHKREQLDSLKYLQYKAKRLFNLPLDRDVIVFLRVYNGKEFSVFYIHNRMALARADFPEGILREDGLQGFLKQIGDAFKTGKNQLVNEQVDEGEELAQCLISIYADKRFDMLPEKGGRNKIIEVIEKQYLSYEKS